MRVMWQNWLLHNNNLTTKRFQHFLKIKMFPYKTISHIDATSFTFDDAPKLAWRWWKKKTAIAFDGCKHEHYFSSSSGLNQRILWILVRCVRREQDVLNDSDESLINYETKELRKQLHCFLKLVINYQYWMFTYAHTQDTFSIRTVCVYIYIYYRCSVFIKPLSVMSTNDF